MCDMGKLRPCIVKIPELKVHEITIRKAKERKGYFHKWSDRLIIGKSPTDGEYATEKMYQTVGIVEYEDGTVHEHYPPEIRFTDRETPDEKIKD